MRLMPRKLTIVAAGEAFLDETGDAPVPGGLAMRAAIDAVRLGHVGVAVSRVGQDAGAQSLLEQARELGVDVDHMQSDPDLLTGRKWNQRFGAGGLMDSRAAFDNLQWDHDLVDLARRAHVIITGALARRSGQTRAEIDRFISEARTALKVFDLVNRDHEQFQRGEQLAMLELVDGVIIDRVAADTLAPAKCSAPLQDAAREMLREFKLDFAVTLNGESSIALVTRDDAADQALAKALGPHHELLIVALTHFITHGCDLDICVQRAAAIVEHSNNDPAQAIAPTLLAVD